MTFSKKKRVFSSENTDLCENVVHLRLSNKLSNRPFAELLLVFTSLFPYNLYYNICYYTTCIMWMIRL